MAAKKNTEDENKNKSSKSLEVERLGIWLSFFSKFAWPILIFLIVAIFQNDIHKLVKRINSFSFAGNELSFANTLSEPVTSLSSLIDVTDTSVELDKVGLLQDALWGECNNFIVLRPNTIPEDYGKKVEHFAIHTQVIKESILCGEFVGLLVLDDKDQYIGAFDRDYFLEAIVPWQKYDDFKDLSKPFDIIEWRRSQTAFTTALEYPVTRLESGEGFTEKVHLSDTISDALKILLDSGKDFIAVVDNYNRFQGVLTKDILINELLLNLASISNEVD